MIFSDPPKIISHQWIPSQALEPPDRLHLLLLLLGASLELFISVSMIQKKNFLVSIGFLFCERMPNQGIFLSHVGFVISKMGDVSLWFVNWRLVASGEKAVTRIARKAPLGS
jgi:hypothetical protein